MAVGAHRRRDQRPLGYGRALARGGGADRRGTPPSAAVRPAPRSGGRPLRLVNAGFDNELWRLGDDLAVRIPRRDVAAALLANEQRWLPGWPHGFRSPFRARARADWVDRPSDSVAVVGGAVADRRPRRRSPRYRCPDAGSGSGRFLPALHQAAPPSAPFNSWRSVPLADRATRSRPSCPASAGTASTPGLRRVWRGRRRGALLRPPVWIHGDLHPAIPSPGAAPWSASSTSVTSAPVIRPLTWLRRGCCYRPTGWMRSPVHRSVRPLARGALARLGHPIRAPAPRARHPRPADLRPNGPHRPRADPLPAILAGE